MRVTRQSTDELGEDAGGTGRGKRAVVVDEAHAAVDGRPVLRTVRVIPDHACLRQQHTNCGKGACKSCGGLRAVHGPYWYAFWSTPTGARNRYVGAHLPPELAAGKTCTPCDCRMCKARRRKAR